MQPCFRLEADGQDLSPLINDRLLSLRTTDKPGLESDTFELRLDARDGVLAVPARGAELTVHLGYADAPLAMLGRYRVDEVEVSGPPDTLVIRGKASDLLGSGRTLRSGSWEGIPLKRIVAQLAARNGWQPVCPVDTVLPRVDQYNESDFNFLTRLARQHNCTAKLANRQLLVLPRQGNRNATGQPLDTVVIQRQDVSQWQFRLDDQARRQTVRTRYPQPSSGTLGNVELANGPGAGGTQPVHTDRHLYPDRAAAEQAARARLASFNRATAYVRLELLGRTDLFAERSLQATGFMPGIDGLYLIESVEHHFAPSGWRTTVVCNAGNQGVPAKPLTTTGRAPSLKA